MPRTRKPSEQSLLADYLLSPQDRDTIANAIHTELSRQQKAGQFGLYRGHPSAIQIAGALAEAACEDELSARPYDPIP